MPTIKFFTLCVLTCWNVSWSQSIVEPSHHSGYYENAFELNLNFSTNVTVLITLDGSNPSEHGEAYSNPLEIGNPDLLPPVIDTIPTTPIADSAWQLAYFRWKQPDTIPGDMWIVRYVAIVDAQIVESGNLTYFIGSHWADKHPFPIASLIVDPESLFDPIVGIYVPGASHTSTGWDDHFFGDGNYAMKGKDWSRSGNLQIFSNSLQNTYSSPVEFRIHGAVVGVFPQKSLRFYTEKNAQGIPLKYSDLGLPDTTELYRFIFRNSRSDFLSTHFRDAFLGAIADSLGLENQKSAPVVMYINGRYWGIHNVRERIDEYYMKTHFDLEPEEYDMIEGTGGEVINGSNEDYAHVLTLIHEKGASDPNIYQEICQHIDIENYIDYIIFQTYFCNMDWPGNNVKFWKPKHGKWRWIFFDGDLMMSPYIFNKDGGYTHDAIAHATADTNNQWYNSKGSTYLLRNLMQNETFRSSFIQRYYQLEKTILSYDYLSEILVDFKTLYKDEIQNQIDRWNYPESVDAWEIEVQSLLEFVDHRSEFYKEHLRNLEDKFNR